MHLQYSFAWLAFGGAFALAQDLDPTPPTDVRQLADRVAAAHHPEGPVRPITGFKSHVDMTVTDTTAEKAGDVELEVQYLAWRPEGRDREQSLIRYRVQDATPIERGRDREGYWQLFQGEARDLRGAEFEQDLEACKKHLNLARQLIRFLDPAAIMRSFAEPSPVRTEDLLHHPGESRAVRTRNTKTPCFVVEGKLASFPLLQQAGDDAAVLLRVFVGKETSRLLAVEAMPITNGKPDVAHMERINLLDLRLDAGLLVPGKLEHLFADADGTLRMKSRVLLRLQLGTELRAEDFDRPKGKPR